MVEAAITQKNEISSSILPPETAESPLPVELRHLEENDLGQIEAILNADIIKAADPDSREGIRQKVEVEMYLHKMEDSLNKMNNRQYTVAVHEGQVAGILGWMPVPKGEKTFAAVTQAGYDLDPNTTAELVNFYVDPSLQKRGIGTKLWERVHQEILEHEHGYRKGVFLSTVRYENMWKWYKKQGYKKVAEGTHFWNQCGFFIKDYFDQSQVIE